MASIYGELAILQAGTGRKLVSTTFSPAQPQEQGRLDPHVASPLRVRVQSHLFQVTLMTPYAAAAAIGTCQTRDAAVCILPDPFCVPMWLKLSVHVQPQCDSLAWPGIKRGVCPVFT